VDLAWILDHVCAAVFVWEELQQFAEMESQQKSFVVAATGNKTRFSANPIKQNYFQRCSVRTV